MQLFMRNIPVATPDYKLELAIAIRLHSPPLSAKHEGTDSPLNFRVKPFVNRFGRHKYATVKNARLIIPIRHVASEFLALTQEYPIRISGRAISVELDRRHQPSADLVKAIGSEPHPGIGVIESEGVKHELSLPFRIAGLQIGGRSRIGEFVVEAELCGTNPHQARKAAIRIEPTGPERFVVALASQSDDGLCQISIPIRAIHGIYVDEGEDQSNVSSATILCRHPVTLQTVADPGDHEVFCERLDGRKPPVPPENLPFEKLSIWELLAEPEQIPMHRMSVIPGKEEQSPYILWDIRIIGRRLLPFLKQVCTAYGLKAPVEMSVSLTYVSSCPTQELRAVESRLTRWPLPVAFQGQTLLSNGLLKPSEVLFAVNKVASLLPRREDIVTAAQALENLSFMPDLLPVYFESTKQPDFQPLDLEKAVIRAVDLAKDHKKGLLRDENAYHRVGHVRMTPTGFILAGPLPDVSNRVLRDYPAHHMHFLRVTFSDENPLERFRITRESNPKEFISERFGESMKLGVQLAGRKFDFLAYSQSSLRDHTVWFVTPFNLGGEVINAAKIRDSLGNFASIVTFPARYAARLSQGFTTTYSSLTVTPDQVKGVHDIKRGGYTFSDISPDLATSITQYLFRLGRISCTTASAFQIRWAGCKGMLFKNPALTGNKITIRPSMEKFTDSPCSMIEIAEVFTTPRPLVLNRPLVQVLEHLGAPAQAFIDLQDEIVSEIYSSTSSFVAAIPFLQKNSLGEAFLVPETFKHLRNLSIAVLPDHLRVFLEDTLMFARISMLRGIKFECHLPVDGCYNLVGGFDESAVLKSDEVFIVVQDGSQDGPLYIQGDVIITRSPVVHPGDIRKVRAIGQPTTDFLRAQMNVIIFSGHGARPIPDMTGGGDLDGDQYHIITEKAKYLWPTNFHNSASYTSATLYDLGRHATIEDVADFVVNYMVSDILGVVCTRLMHIADQSKKGFDDERCRMLASLASAAVDFPKSGTPVSIDSLPKPDQREKPDFMADESRYKEKARGGFYNSPKVLGVLFRKIDLPTEPALAARPERQTHNHARAFAYAEAIRSLVGQQLANAADVRMTSGLKHLYSYYCREVTRIASAYKITTVPINEAEIYLGALAATGKKFKRKTNTKAMHTETTYLLKIVRADLLPHQPESAQKSDWQTALTASYAAWSLSLESLDRVGACSFNLVAFEAIIRCIVNLQRPTAR